MARLLDRWAAEDAIKRSGLPGPQRLLLFVLLTHVKNGTLTIPSEYSPSLTGLVEETGLGRGTVADHLNKLEAAGWVQRFRPTTKAAIADKAPTTYRISIPEALLQALSDPSESRTSPGAGLVREPDGSQEDAGQNPSETRTSPGAGHIPIPSSSSPSEKKRKGGAGGNRRAPKSDDEHPRFADFYAAYPKKVDPADARRAFNRAVKKVDDPQVLIDGAARYAREKATTEKRYIKAPAVWLNKESWLNEPETPLAATGTDGRAANRFGPLANVNDEWAQVDPENFHPFGLKKGNRQ